MFVYIYIQIMFFFLEILNIEIFTSDLDFLLSFIYIYIYLMNCFASPFCIQNSLDLIFIGMMPGQIYIGHVIDYLNY